MKQAHNDYQAFTVTDDEWFLEEMFAFDDDLCANLAGLEFAPTFADICVEISRCDVGQLIDFKLHLEEKKKERNTME